MPAVAVPLAAEYASHAPVSPVLAAARQRRAASRRGLARRSVRRRGRRRGLACSSVWTISCTWCRARRSRSSSSRRTTACVGSIVSSIRPTASHRLDKRRRARGDGARVRSRRALRRCAEPGRRRARMLEIGVAYASERRQFGQPIGAYQGLKHQFASAQVKLEFARPVVYARGGARRDGSRARCGRRLACEARGGRGRRCLRPDRDAGAWRDGILLGGGPALLHEARLGARRCLGRRQLPCTPRAGGVVVRRRRPLGPGHTFSAAEG